MTTFEPTRPAGATFHTCETCGGSGWLDDDNDECISCDGTGEWFE